MIKSSECFGAKSKIYAVLAPTRLDHFVCFDSLRIPFERIRQFQDHTSLNKMWTLVRGYADYSSALKLRFHCRLYLRSLQRLQINRMKIDAPLSARLENGSELTHRRNSSQKWAGLASWVLLCKEIQPYLRTSKKSLSVIPACRQSTPKCTKYRSRRRTPFRTSQLRARLRKNKEGRN